MTAANMDELIALPDLDGAVDLEISTEDVAAAAALYYAYQLEEIRLFQVIDRIVDLFQQGLLPLGRDGAAEALEQLVRRPRRDAEAVRRNAYWRMFGLARGDVPPGEPNGEFRSLWTHLIVAVAERAAADGASSSPTADANVHAAAQAVARNLSTHAWNGVQSIADQITADARQAMEIVGDRDVQRAFGARSAWQVIDRVNLSHLGHAVDLARFRTQAKAARRIFDQLAQLNRPARDDAELVVAVEEWTNASSTDR